MPEECWGLKPDGRVDYQEFMRLWCDLAAKQQTAADAQGRAIALALSAPDEAVAIEALREARGCVFSLDVLSRQTRVQQRLFDEAHAAGLVDFADHRYGVLLGAKEPR